jgi:hypothetical protein
MATKYRVVQVKGEQPESFIVVGIDFEAATITSTSEVMREPEMRIYLEKSGGVDGRDRAVDRAIEEVSGTRLAPRAKELIAGICGQPEERESI